MVERMALGSIDQYIVAAGRATAEVNAIVAAGPVANTRLGLIQNTFVIEQQLAFDQEAGLAFLLLLLVCETGPVFGEVMDSLFVHPPPIPIASALASAIIRLSLSRDSQ